MIKFRWETEFKKTEIGEIPKDWEVRKLGGLCNITSSKRIYFKEYVSYGIPFYRGKEIILLSKGENIANSLFISLKKYEELKNKYGIPQAGDLLLTAIGTIGYIYRVRESDKFYFKDGNILWIRNFTKRVNSLYLKYILPFLLKIQELSIGSSQEALTIEKLKELITLLPPPPEQSRIATVLSWFDNLIENKKRQNEILEKTAMAIFKSWFVDFEPFQDEDFVYNEDLDKEIPKGWEVASILNISEEVVSGEWGKDNKDNKNNFKFYCVKGADIPTLSKYDFIPLSMRYSTYDKFKKRILKEGDIIIEISGGSINQSTGRTLLVTSKLLESYNLPMSTTNFCRIIKISNYFLSLYVYLWLKYWYITDKFYEYEEGTTSIKNLQFKDFFNHNLIPIPPQPILEKFHSLVEPLFQKIILNQKQIMVLRKIRDALLPQLVFGKLRVAEL